MTAYLALDGNLLERACIVLPRTGAWTADVEHIDTSTALAGGNCSLTFGTQTFVGTVVRVQSNQAPGYDTRIVGGNGNLSKVLPGAQFKSPTLQNVLDAAIRDGGEELSSTSSTLSTSVNFWERSSRTLGQELDAIAAAAGVEWKVLLGGTIWLGTPDWADSDLDPVDYQVLESHADTGMMLVAAEDPVVLAGQTFEGIRVGQVIHRIEPDATRTEVYTDTGVDRAMGALDALIRRSAPRDLFAFYEYKVISQSGDTLELRTLDARMPDLSKVPYRPGVPGAVYTVAAGARCLVGFAGGSEQTPYIAGWTAGTPSEVSFPVSSDLYLGADGTGSKVALSPDVDTNFDQLRTALNSWVVVPGDGGAALKVLLTALFATGWPFDTAATKVSAT